MNILPWKHANDDVSTIKTTTTRCVEDTQEEKAVVVATAISGKTVITTKPQTPTSSSSTTSWMKSKDPRIVRVSRAFGGKDRHSKVCTLRGLRDRRVRLSVPTAIQLYDLQERLGVDQPSKAVDWLLDVAKNDIDELPPLPVSPETFSLFNHHQAFLNLGQRRPGQDPTMTQLGFKLNNGCLQEESACNTSKERGQNDVVFTNNHHVIGSYGSYNNMEHYHQQQQQQQHLSFQGDYHQVQSFVPYPSQVLLCPMTTLASTTTTTTTTTSSTIQTLFPSSTNSSGAMESMDPRLMVSHFQMPLMGSSSQNTSTLYSLLQHGKSNNNNGSSGN